MCPACRLEYTTLRNVTDRSEVWYDPDPLHPLLEEDKEIVEEALDIETDECVPPSTASHTA